MNNWERMKAGRLYNADSKDLEKYHSFGMEAASAGKNDSIRSSRMSACRSSIRMVSMTLSMQSRSTSEAEVGSVRARRSVVG